jgi:hypothetical protein
MLEKKEMLDVNEMSSFYSCLIEMVDIVSSPLLRLDLLDLPPAVADVLIKEVVLPHCEPLVAKRASTCEKCCFLPGGCCF